MWRVEKKRENGIKEGGAIKIENEEIKRETHEQSRTNFVIKPERNI